MTINPGNLRHRVTFQSLTTADDGYGGTVETWGDTATVWASVEPLSGFERIQAMQVSPRLSHRVVMRYRADVDAGDRLSYDGRVFDITAVIDEDERHRELTLLCEEER